MNGRHWPHSLAKGLSSRAHLRLCTNTRACLQASAGFSVARATVNLERNLSGLGNSVWTILSWLGNSLFHIYVHRLCPARTVMGNAQVIDRPYSLGCATVGALYERPRCIFCAKPLLT